MINQAVDLTNCDREKIHHITAIQPHGAFLSVHRVDHKIRNVSENLATFFNREGSSEVFVGKRLNDLLTLELAMRITECIQSQVLPAALEWPSGNGGVLEIHLFALADDLVGVEFETNENKEEVSTLMNEYLEKMQRAQGLRGVSHVAAQAVRHLTGFERVMIYRFFPPTMFGEVIAEDKIASAHSFLDHRFPATDIPRPARDLYLRNKVRYIHDSAGVEYPIQPPVYDKKLPLDMSDSRLRSVSKIHLEYLKNMGVRGSMSVAIIVDGNLWGIISCHHSEPKYVSQATRKLCLQIANALAMVGPILERLSITNEENRFYAHLHGFFNAIKLEADPVSFMFHKVDDLCALFSCQGFSLVTPGKTTSGGVTPRNKDVEAIWGALKEKMNGEVYESQEMTSLDPKFADLKEQVSGILAIRVSPADDSMLIFMRPEFLHEILWGGDPRKNLESRNYNGVINPRASFETWTEVVKGSSLPWKDHELNGARNFRNLVFDSLVRKEQLIEELHQRLKARH